MSRAKAWRRAALATYIAAGAALTLAGYTVATTAANANTLRDTRERIEDFQREQTAIAENSISAASVRRGTLPPDTRPPVAPDWPALAERAMPSVVALAGIDKPYGTGQNNHAWRIPGVQQNAATAALTRIRAWHRDWPKEDAKRRQRIICGGVADIDNLSRNQDIAVGLQVILKPRARPTPTWTSMPERTLDFEF